MMGSDDLTRRQVLGLTASLAVSIFVLPGCVENSSSSGMRDSVFRVVGGVVDTTPPLLHLGRRVEQEDPVAADLTLELLEQEADESAARAALVAAAAADAATGSFVAIDGWLIPRRLAGLAGLVYRLA